MDDIRVQLPKRPEVRQAAYFEILVQRLLLRHLARNPALGSHARIIQEARVARALASQTPFPLLVFPCLFQERAAAALEDWRRQERLFWNATKSGSSGNPRVVAVHRLATAGAPGAPTK